MSLDDPRFRFAPYCRLSAITMIEPGDGDSWNTTNEHGITGALDSKDFKDRCLSLNTDDRGAGLYSVVSEGEGEQPKKFLIIEEDRTVFIEGLEEPIDLDEFRTLAVRCSPEGKLICSLTENLDSQWEKCKLEDDADDHLMNIRELASLYGDSTKSGELYDHHMYNLISTEMDDGRSYMELMKMITTPSHNDGPVHERFGLDAVIGGWIEVKEHPNYMKAQIRTAFDTFMKEMLGDYPYDKVSMTNGREIQFSEELEDNDFELIGMAPPFQGGNNLPGYETSDVAFHRGKGVDVVVFTDFMGTYAYAWPTEEGGKYEPQPFSSQMRMM